MSEVAAIAAYPRIKARTLRFGCGAPHAAQAIGDGTRALFLRSDGAEDLVNNLWMSWFDAAGNHHETELVDARNPLGAEQDDKDVAGDEDVPPEERARRERAREGGAGIVSYSVDDAGKRVVYVIGSRLFVSTVDIADGTQDSQGQRPACVEVRTSEILVADLADQSQDDFDPTPVLNPRISPDGRRVAWSTGSLLVVFDLQSHAIDAVMGVTPEHRDVVKVGLAEFAAGEEMDRYEGFWWGPDSRTLLIERFSAEQEPVWYISDPTNPEAAATARRYPRALSSNAQVALYAVRLGENGTHVEAAGRVAWDSDAYEYLAVVNWRQGHNPLLLVQNRRQTDDQVLEVLIAGDDAHWLDADVLDAAVDAEVAVDADQPEASATSWPMIETRVLQEHHNDQWLDLIAGTPAYTPDGRLVCALNDMQSDTNRLTVDARPFTPVGWNVRTVLSVTDQDVLCVIQRDPQLAHDVPAEWGEHADTDQHDARSFDVVSFDYDGHVRPITTTPGVWTATRGESGLVVSGRTMGDRQPTMLHCLCGVQGERGSQSSQPQQTPAGEAMSSETMSSENAAIADSAANDAGSGDWTADTAFDDVTAEYRTSCVSIASYAADPGFTPNTHFVTMPGEHALLAAITMPSAGSEYAKAAQLPVLMLPYGGPGFQQVALAQSYYRDAQWWANQGFVVVTADGRGTTGRGPKWDREIFENMKAVTLADQVEAVHGLAELMKQWPADAPRPNLDKVSMIGWSYGGFLSALAVLDAPNVFKAACAGAPPTDWTLYDTHYTERYLGLDPAVYERNSIIADAPKLVRPLMLIHGFADDNVTIAHSLRLSQALMAAGRPHTFLPLTGITHMTNDETVAENLLVLQRDFLKQALAD
ncbi:S9 family peptidase [Bifidobacterium oedipodis]|nr:prolyl oligopeptidase family serine peptidase [Bifidobacterium sp. DSM 109957]